MIIAFLQHVHLLKEEEEMGLLYNFITWTREEPFRDPVISYLEANASFFPLVL